MIEFEIGGKSYRADKLNAFQQFHVSRKIAPLIPALIPVFLAISKKFPQPTGGKSGVLQKSPQATTETPGVAAAPKPGVAAPKAGVILESIPELAPLLQPFADGIAALPDDSAEYVMSTCLAVLRRHHGDNWTPVWSASAKAMMFDDINNLGAMLPLVVRVIVDNLGPFISGLLTSQQETSSAPPAA